MESTNWPMWIIAFAVLLVALGLTAVFASVVFAVLRLAALLQTAMGMVSGLRAMLSRARLWAADAVRGPARDRPGLSASEARAGLRALSIIATVLEKVAHVFSRIRRKPR